MEFKLANIVSKLKNSQGFALPNPSVLSAIDALTDAERIEVREAAMRIGCESLPRNLFYNYETQCWILTPAELVAANAKVDAALEAMGAGSLNTYRDRKYL